MIDLIHLRNFQIHAERIVQLERITTFCGDNDRGKSSILRALSFLMFNVWDGSANDHVTWGQDQSCLSMSVDGRMVSRAKGPNVNEYMLDGQVYKAFGAGKVPDPIAKLLNVGQDNIQRQDDPAFWLSLTSGQAASALNEIFNLSAIDDALEAVGSELRAANHIVKSIQDRLDRATVRKDELSWVVQANEDLKELEALEREQEEIDSELESLTKLLKTLETNVEVERALLSAISTGEVAIKSWEEGNAIGKEIEHLQKILDLQTQIKCHEEQLKETEKKLKDATPEVCSLCGRSF